MRCIATTPPQQRRNTAATPLQQLHWLQQMRCIATAATAAMRCSRCGARSPLRGAAQGVLEAEAVGLGGDPERALALRRLLLAPPHLLPRALLHLGQPRLVGLARRAQPLRRAHLRPRQLLLQLDLAAGGGRGGGGARRGRRGGGGKAPPVTLCGLGASGLAEIGLRTGPADP